MGVMGKVADIGMSLLADPVLILIILMLLAMARFG